MTHSIIKTSFVAGELAPSLWGALDYAKFAAGCTTMRNCFVNYRSGASSRAGMKFVGQCLAPGAGLPPRPITFQVNVNLSYVLEFGNRTMRVVFQGGYITETPFNISAVTNGNPAQMTAVGNNFVDQDWVAVSGIVGMTELNSRTLLATNPAGNNFTLSDTFGDPINSLAFNAYVSGGQVARIFTLATPYAIEDIPYLKFTQSADVMTIDCVNTITGTEYPTYELTRLSPASWTLSLVSYGSSITPPTNTTAVASNTIGASPATYKYVITAIDAETGDESVASAVATCSNSVNIAVTEGSITVTWLPPAAGRVQSYNIYKAPAGVHGATVPIGSSFGYAGSAVGLQLVDTNIVQDFSRTPPLHKNPFARGQVAAAVVTATGAGYVQDTTTITVNSATGSGAVLVPVIVTGFLVGVIIENRGQNYANTDTATVVGAGAGGTLTITIGAQSGTFPGVAAYFQQRLVQAASLNAPDRYDMSKPGARSNFDAGNPPVDDDALSGTPWGQQVNGIQWMLPTTGGLLCMTGLSIWKVSGGGAVAITPASQDAEPQEYNGISATIAPIRIKQNVLYVQDKGSLVNDLEFNFYNNTFTGTDISFLSHHLFVGYEFVQWAWAQEPNKLVWVVRDDGKFLSLTYVKDQKIAGWGRHDTNGLAVDVTVASENPVDAPYFVIKRYVPAKARWAYYMERLDNRIWRNAEDVWAVDCGLALEPSEPAATLQAAAASGNGVGFTASASVFNGSTVGAVGQVIRYGGGKATITQYVSPTQVLANITLDITLLMPNDPNRMPAPQPTGNWSVATPVTEVSGLDHLEGFTVTGLADGAVITPQVVSGGRVTLAASASAIVVGLPFQAQLQGMHLEVPGAETLQGNRKKVPAVRMRLEGSRGVKVGVSQPIASAAENQAETAWGQGDQFVGKMIEYAPVQNQLSSGAYLPLLTGDLNVNTDADFEVLGMVAFQQDYPLPMNVLMYVSEFVAGDTSG